MQNNGASPIGFIISWHVPTIVNLAELRDGVTKIGLDPLELVPDLKPASLVARSAGLVAKEMTGKDIKRLARKVEGSKRQITAEERTVLGDALTYGRDFAVQFDEQTKTVVTDTGYSLTRQQDEVTATRRATDVTRVVQRVVESAGSDLIQIREQGGAYFVPAGHAVIANVRTVLEAVGGTLSQFACTIGHGDQADRTGQSVANVITDYLLKQIEDLQVAVDELNEGGIRSDVKRARLTKVADLRERVANYATLLQAQGGALTRAIDKAEETLLAKLGPEKSPEAAAEAIMAVK